MSEQYASVDGGTRFRRYPPPALPGRGAIKVQAGAEARLAVCDETRDVSGTQDDKKKTTISPENECLIVLVFIFHFQIYGRHEHKKGGVWGKKPKKTRP